MGRLILLGKAIGIVVILIGLKLMLDWLNLDLIPSGPVTSGLVAGVIFTIAAVFTGVLADFKEAEKIPGELAATLKSLYREAHANYAHDETRARGTQDNIRNLLEVILSNFDRNTWKMREINIAIDHLDEDIDYLAAHGVPAPYVVRMRSELNAIDKMCNRIETMIETSFIPAAYMVAWIATVVVLLALLFTRMDSSVGEFVVFGAVAFILVALNLLIRDMDNPFETGGKSAADVDLSHLRKLQKLLKEKTAAFCA
jgi:predicted membrane chloride channel (bestrophin family)